MHLDTDSESNPTEACSAGSDLALNCTCECWRRFGQQHWGHDTASRASSLDNWSKDCHSSQPSYQWLHGLRVAAESSSRERWMWCICRSWKKHLALTAVTCLSNDRSSINMTPRIWTASDATTWVPLSVKKWQPTEIFDTLYLVPIHNTSVLFTMSLSWLAAIHCSTTKTHCCKLTERLLIDSDYTVGCCQRTLIVTCYILQQC